MTDVETRRPSLASRLAAVTEAQFVRVQYWASGVAGAMVLLVTRITHAAVGTDAVCYIGVADQIVDGGGLGFWLEDPLATWPPLWPVLLAIVQWPTGLRGDIIAVLLNVVLTAATVLLLARIVFRVIERNWLRVLCVLAVGVGPTVLGLAAFVQTETIFNVFLLGAILCVIKFDETERWAFIGGAVVITWAAFLSRYVGLYFVPIFGGWLLLPRREGTSVLTIRRWRVGPALGYSLAALVVPLAWIARNTAVSGTALGPRFESGVSVPRNTLEALAGVSNFLLGVELPEKPAALMVLALVGLVVVLALWALRPTLTPRNFLERATRLGASPLGLLVLFGGIFGAGLIISRSRYGFDNLDIRLMAPTLLPFAVATFAIVERAVLDGRAGGHRTRAVATLGLLGWSALQLVLAVLLVGPLNSIVSDFGYNRPEARAVAFSPLLDEFEGEDCVVFSNNPFDLYRSGFTAQLSPRRLEYQSIETTDELPRLVERVERGEPVCLAWVAYTDDETFWTLDDLDEAFTLEEIGEDGDLSTYRVLPAA